MQLSIRIKDPILHRLATLAKKTGRSKSYYVMEALDKHLNDLEDIYLAERELEKIRAGRIKTISWEDVKKRNKAIYRKPKK